MKTPIISSDFNKMLYSVPCLVCGELIPLDEPSDRLQMCSNCKEAILYARMLKNKKRRFKNGITSV